MTDDQSQPIPPQDPMAGGATPGAQDDSGMLTDFTGAKFDPKQIQNAAIPAHQLQFDEKHFLNLLAGSISLTFSEKQQIIQTIPKLKQEQITELIKILEDEKVKFEELNQKHVEKLKELEAKHQQEWEQLALKAEEAVQAETDQKKADDLKRELGLLDDDSDTPKAA